jgi:outer membrane protein assembly factor BamD
MYKVLKLITASGLALALLLALGCRGGKSAKLQSSTVPPDKTLFENGEEWLKKSQFTKARLAFQTLINTYPDSELTPKAFFAIADSYYKESGHEALLQAEAQYKDFMVFYPTHEKAAEAQLKIAALNMRMMEDPDRDPTYTKRAQDELKRFIAQFPDHPLIPEAKEKLKEVQENLAESIYLKGQYYYKKRSLKAAAARYTDLRDKFPQYSKLDTALTELGKCLEKLERKDEAIAAYAQVAKAYEGPNAEFARKRLEELEQPIPPADPALVAMHKENGKPKPGFSLTPVNAVKNAMSIFRTGRDPYEDMTQAASARTEAAKSEGTLAQSKEDDILIKSVIKKSANSETTAETTIDQPNTSSNIASPAQNQKPDEKGQGDKDKNKKKKDKGFMRRIFR